MVADLARPPIDKACGEGLMPQSVGDLKALGVALGPSQAVPFRGIRFLGEGRVAESAFPNGFGLGIRRTTLQQAPVESAQYPEITFVPEQVQEQGLPQGDFKVQVLGTFTMHGAGHPLTLVVQAHRAGEQLTADTHFTIPYVSWGLKNPSSLFLRVNDTVDIAIHAAGQIKFKAAH